MSPNPKKLRTRLAFDWRNVVAMQNASFAVAPFATVDDAAAGRVLDTARAEKGEVAVYLVTYRFPMLTRGRQPLPEAQVLFNLLVGGDYPRSKPARRRRNGKPGSRRAASRASRRSSPCRPRPRTARVC